MSDTNIIDLEHDLSRSLKAMSNGEDDPIYEYLLIYIKSPFCDLKHD